MKYCNIIISLVALILNLVLVVILFNNGGLFNKVNNLKETSYKHFMQNVCKLKKSANKVGENNE